MDRAKAGETTWKKARSGRFIFLLRIHTHRLRYIYHEAFDRQQICGSVELTLGRQMSPSFSQISATAKRQMDKKA
jgi:hypothetical protein